MAQTTQTPTPSSVENPFTALAENFIYLVTRARFSLDGTLLGLDDEKGDLKWKVSEKSSVLVKPIEYSKDNAWMFTSPIR